MKIPIMRSASFFHFGPAVLRGMALLATMLAAPVTNAADHTDDDERFSLSIGVFIADRDNGTRIDASNGDRGTEVDIENDLGLENSSTVFRLDGYYKFNDRHRIDFSWFDLSRTATNQITGDIDWNDTTFPAGTTLDSTFDLDIYKLAYTWSFMRRDKGFLGATAGVYVMDFATILDGRVINQREIADATAPLPVVGLRGEYDFSDKWTFRASGEVFGFRFEDSDGLLVDVYAGIDYQLFNNAAIGLGLNAVHFDIDFSLTNFNGNVDWGYTGALAFLKFAF